MWQGDNSQIANFDMASLRVIGSQSSSCVPRFIDTQGRIDATERKRRNANAHQWQACHLKLLCNRLFRSVYYGRGAGEVRTHESTATFLATRYLVNDTNGDDDSLIKQGHWSRFAMANL